MWVPLLFLFNWVKYPAGVGCHFLLQGNFSTQGLNVGLLPSRQIPYRVSHQGSPIQKSRNHKRTQKRSQKSRSKRG